MLSYWYGWIGIAGCKQLFENCARAIVVPCTQWLRIRRSFVVKIPTPVNIQAKGSRGQQHPAHLRHFQFLRATSQEHNMEMSIFCMSQRSKNAQLFILWSQGCCSSLLIYETENKGNVSTCNLLSEILVITPAPAFLVKGKERHTPAI